MDVIKTVLTDEINLKLYEKIISCIDQINDSSKKIRFILKESADYSAVDTEISRAIAELKKISVLSGDSKLESFIKTRSDLMYEIRQMSVGKEDFEAMYRWWLKQIDSVTFEIKPKDKIGNIAININTNVDSIFKADVHL